MSDTDGNDNNELNLNEAMSRYFRNSVAHKQDLIIFIPFVFPQFTSAIHNSPYSMFHSFHGLINSFNWPA